MRATPRLWDGNERRGLVGAGHWFGVGRKSGMAGVNGGIESDEGEQASWLTFVVDEGWGFICINPVTLQRIQMLSLSPKSMKL